MKNILFDTYKILMMAMLFFVASYTSSVQAQDVSTKQKMTPQKIAPLNVDKKNVAVKGYDVVSYFEESKAQKGNREFAVEWEGAIWYFSNAEHQKLFEKAPNYYAPQYGGFCAYGVSKGYKAKIDPEAWSIYKGKLYLNYSKSIRKKWRKDKDGYIETAEKNWVTL